MADLIKFLAEKVKRRNSIYSSQKKVKAKCLEIYIGRNDIRRLRLLSENGRRFSINLENTIRLNSREVFKKYYPLWKKGLDPQIFVLDLFTKWRIENLMYTKDSANESWHWGIVLELNKVI